MVRRRRPRNARGQRQGSVLLRVFSHDVYHTAELNEALGIAGLTQVNLWD
jgi:hypothetical protein